MIIIGEKLNSSIPKTLDAINGKDEKYLIELIKSQSECSADFLDINTAICGDAELSNMLWLIDLTLKNSNCGIMLDSPSPAVIKEAIKAVSGRPVIVNSVTITDRIDELLPIIKESGAYVVGLPIDGRAIPETVEMRVKNAKILIEKITAYGIPADKIFIDVLVEALCASGKKVLNSIYAIREIKKLYPDIKTLCGISNVSFGMPERVNINCAYLAMAIANGLDAAIFDITSPVKKTLLASLAIAGEDENCINYISEIKIKGTGGVI